MVSITKVTNCASGIDTVADQNSKAISNSVSVKSDMQIITHNSVPVVTTEMLADFYGSDLKNLQMNHLRFHTPSRKSYHLLMIAHPVAYQSIEVRKDPSPRRYSRPLLR